MIKNKICRMCGKELDNNAWYCPACKRINDAAKQREAYRKTKLAKKDFTNRKLARLKSMLDGVDLTPYLPKPGQELSEAQDE